MDRVFRSLKTEWIPTTGYRTAQQPTGHQPFFDAAVHWIRLNQFNGGLAPAQAEEKT
jgi:putative transposase